MTVTRRALLGLAAGFAPATALAFETTFGSPGENPGMTTPDGEIVDYMKLRLADNASFAARSGLVVTDAGAWFGAFRGKTVVRDENKIGIVKDIPLVGELFSDRLREKDFDPALRIGSVFRVGETLVIDLHLTRVTVDTLAQTLLNGSGRPSESLTLPDFGGERLVPKSLIAANQMVSYHVPAAVLAGVDPARPPEALTLLAEPGRAEVIGEAYRHAEGHLLTLVRPSILTGWS
jgi:hypothetical protein